MLKTQTLIDNAFFKAEVVPDAVRNCMRVLAYTKPVAAPLNFVEQKLTSEPCYWTYHRWARAIRWMLGKKWLRWMIPYPIQALVYATEVTTTPKVFQWPTELMDKIHAQIAGLHAEGQKPTVILVGRKAECDMMMSSPHINMMPVMKPERGNQRMNYRGIPVVSTNKLEHEAVLVVAYGS